MNVKPVHYNKLVHPIKTRYSPHISVIGKKTFINPTEGRLRDDLQSPTQ